MFILDIVKIYIPGICVIKKQGLIGFITMLINLFEDNFIS